MEKLASQFRFMYLFAHMAHHFVRGPLFMQDHSHFGDLYETYEGLYDGILEKMVGLDLSPNEFAINTEAVAKLNSFTSTDFSSNADYFRVILNAEKEICSIAQALDAGATYGCKNLFQGIADASEDRQYKLKQRLS